MKSKLLKQLPLGFALSGEAQLGKFYPGRNRMALEILQAIALGQGEHFVYLWGGAGVGKTHLLQGTVLEANTRDFSTCYLAFSKQEESAEKLIGLENLGLVCLDNLENIIGNMSAEKRLFYLFNGLRENGHRLVVACNQSVHGLNFALPDLKSRLTWGLTYQLHTLSDSDKIKALQCRASARGLILSDLVGQYLLKRVSREIKHLFSTLEILDKASLSTQRALTVPFVKEVLSL